jgi:hypothetical protein
VETADCAGTRIVDQSAPFPHVRDRLTDVGICEYEIRWCKKFSSQRSCRICPRIPYVYMYLCIHVCM